MRRPSWLGGPRGEARPGERKSAGLVPVYEGAAVPHLLFIKRTERVGMHKGEIGFPGGRLEPEDTGPLAAALREAYEEVGILPELVTPLASETLAAATDLVGYAPYLARVAERAGQRRHESDNREELARARQALRIVRPQPHPAGEVVRETLHQRVVQGMRVDD